MGAAKRSYSTELQSLVRLKQEYRVIVANTADRGLELAGQELQPQLALINASLNHSGDGIELCQRIRRLPNGDELGILLISDTSSEEEYQQGLAAGVIDFIQQPISHTLLRALLSRQVRQRE